MERKNNGYFKAVSIISLVLAILLSVVTLMIIFGAMIDFNTLVVTFAEIDNAGVPDADMASTYSIVVVMFVLTILYLVGYIVFHFLAFFKLKKYSNLTNEEAKQYSGRIIAWTILMFLISGLVSAILMILGYENVTKKQVEELAMQQNQTQVETKKNSQTETSDVDVLKLDTMIARLEKLNKIKELGGLTDEEYEELRKKIIDADK